MEYSKFYLVIGVFFQEKDLPAIGFDPQIGERVKIQSVIEHIMFSGVLDTILGIGAFQDIYGQSNIEISSFKTNFENKISKLSFLKEYPTHTLSYELLSIDAENSSQEWIGKWTFQEDSGFVRMKTIEIDKKIFFDYKSIEKDELYLANFPKEKKQDFSCNNLGTDPVDGGGHFENEDDLPF